MHSEFRQRAVVGSLQHKRVLDNAFSLTAPITLTIITTPTETSAGQIESTSELVTTSSSSSVQTSSVLQTSSSVSQQAYSSSVYTMASALSTTTTSSIEVATQPIVSVINSSTSILGSSVTVTPVASSALESQTLPAGAIVGLVIGSVIIVLAVAIIVLRNRFVKSRKARRATWMKKGGVANIPGVTPAPFGYTEGNIGDLSPGVTFARAQTQAINLPRPIPPPPPPPTTFNNSPPPMTLRTDLPTNAATVKFTFIPSLPDELSISNGEVVIVLQEYDDGWAWCENNRGDKGMIPLECLDRATTSTASGGMVDYRNSRRASSLNVRRL